MNKFACLIGATALLAAAPSFAADIRVTAVIDSGPSTYRDHRYYGPRDHYAYHRPVEYRSYAPVVVYREPVVVYHEAPYYRVVDDRRHHRKGRGHGHGHAHHRHCRH